MAYQKYPAELKTKALELLAEGKSSVEVSKIVKVPASTVCNWSYITTSTKRIPVELIDKLIEGYSKGSSIVMLEKDTGCSRRSISKILTDRGIEILNYGARKRSVKNNPFVDLNNPDVNYWLGLLAADGHVLDRGTVKISSIDLDILEKFSEFTGCNKPVYCQGRVWTCGFMNKEVANYLVSLGITARKSLSLNLQIPLTADFIRGYWDGNGSCTVAASGQVFLEVNSGSKIFVSQLELFLKDNCIEFKTSIREAGVYKYKGESRPTSPHYRIRILKNQEAFKFLNLVYGQAVLSIKRKLISAKSVLHFLLDKDIV